MKKILFLAYRYPYGTYNATTACSVRIMKALAENPEYEVHCISYKQGSDGLQPYSSINNVHLHHISLKEPRKSRNRYMTYFQMVLRMPIYPIYSLSRIYRHYLACKNICKKENFDLVIGHYFSEECAFAGMLLRKFGVISKYALIFWDNMYGKEAAGFIPAGFALRRKKKAENYLAKYTDALISLYPIKPFHNKFGELPAALGKRYYLGIPFVLPPQAPVETSHLQVVKPGKVNILYSGSIIRPEYIEKFIDILNNYCGCTNINLIFFSRGLSEEKFESLRSKFRGTIQSPGYVPVQELLSVYNHVDAFISFPGDIHSICSKVYDYMSYGRPVLILFDSAEDVNVETFSKYPLSHCLNLTKDKETINEEIDMFIKTMIGKKLPFNQVKELFSSDTPEAYVDLISTLVNTH